MTDIELQKAQDIARIESALGDLMALETVMPGEVVAWLKNVRTRLRGELTIRPQRSDAGVKRKADDAPLLDMDVARADAGKTRT